MSDATARSDTVWPVAPLGRAEEHALAVRAQRGDSDATWMLALATGAAVVGLARRIDPSRNHVADLVHEGVLAALAQVPRFDVERGTRFLTFVAPHVRRAMGTYLRSRTGAVSGQRGIGPVPVELGEAQTEPGLAEDPTAELDRWALTEAVGAALKTLTAEERVVLEMAFGFPRGHALPLRRIGRLLGLHPDAVRRIRNRAVAKLGSAGGPLDAWRELYDAARSVRRREAPSEAGASGGSTRR